MTSVSNDLRKTTNKLFTIKNDIHVIHNFIDTQKYDKVHQLKCNRIAIAKPNERILTHVSNFRPVKRIEDVINVFYEVQKTIPSKLLLIGEGPDRAKAEHLVNKLQISKEVLFFGNSSDVSKILCYSDVFLLPSQTESFGLAALEAMAAKTAVISTNTGGLPEVNIHGVTGYLSDLGDVQDMADNAVSILENDEILETFKENAREHTTKFSLENILPVYESIYKSCFNN